jgi:hypothetical protein
MLELVGPILSEPGELLGELNIRLINAVLEFLEIDVRTELASTLDVRSKSDERLAELATRVGGSVYVSGAGGENYQEEERFRNAGIELEVRRYEPVSYPQGDDEFLPGLSVVDALAHMGRDARKLLRYGGADPDASS